MGLIVQVQVKGGGEAYGLVTKVMQKNCVIKIIGRDKGTNALEPVSTQPPAVGVRLEEDL